jgi:hypothetical protein
MKPFNLEKALAGEPVVTYDERKVVDLHYFEQSKSKYKLIAQIEDFFTVDLYTIDGLHSDDREFRFLDLFMDDSEQQQSS